MSGFGVFQSHKSISLSILHKHGQEPGHRLAGSSITSALPCCPHALFVYMNQVQKVASTFAVTYIHVNDNASRL